MIDRINAIAKGFEHIGWTYYQWRCGGLRWEALLSENPITRSPWSVWRVLNTIFSRKKDGMSDKDYLVLLQEKYAYCWSKFNGN